MKGPGAGTGKGLLPVLLYSAGMQGGFCSPAFSARPSITMPDKSLPIITGGQRSYYFSHSPPASLKRKCKCDLHKEAQAP